MNHKDERRLTHGRGRAGGGAGTAGIIGRRRRADRQRGRLERGGLRGELGRLLLVVEGLRDLPPQRAQPLLPLRPQRLRHLAARRRRRGGGKKGALELGFWGVSEAKEEET
uniref:Uncharacterized protein n=1 Tax=Oryza meridionalis TaxID=40149 RepID=A0A0E0DI67_9ORYZ